MREGGSRLQVHELLLLRENQHLKPAQGFFAAGEEHGTGKDDDPFVVGLCVSLHAEVIFGDGRGVWDKWKREPQGNLFCKH